MTALQAYSNYSSFVIATLIHVMLSFVLLYCGTDFVNFPIGCCWNVLGISFMHKKWCLMIALDEVNKTVNSFAPTSLSGPGGMVCCKTVDLVQCTMTCWSSSIFPWIEWFANSIKMSLYKETVTDLMLGTLHCSHCQSVFFK